MNTSHQVSALFARREVSFLLSKGATFGDLADRLDKRVGGQPGHPQAIFLKFKLPENERSMRVGGSGNV